MINVRLIYHSYTETMSIFVDNQPIGMISALSRYQSQPFSEWCASILPAVAAEVNDDFSLTFVGRRCEYDMLVQHNSQCPSCTAVEYEQPSLNDSALQRLNKLNRLMTNGVECSQFSKQLRVYTDLPSSKIEHILSSVFPELRFCCIQMQLEPLSSILQENKRSDAIAIIAHSTMQPESITKNVFGCIAIEGERKTCVDGMFLLSSKPQTLSKVFLELLELGYFPTLLKEAISHTQPPTGGSIYSDFFVLDKTEPQVIARLPRSIEVGETAPIQVFTVPDGLHIPEITCRISSNSVLNYTPQGLRAVGTGEAVVEVYEAGRSTPLTKGTVNAYRRNRIVSISASPTKFRLCVGESAKLLYKYEPIDADNVSNLRLICQDPSVGKVVSLNAVKAIKPGVTTFAYEAEKVKSERFELVVYPRLERIDLSMNCTELKIGSMEPLHIRRYPEDAKLDKLTVRVEPPTLGSYEPGTGRFFARTGGLGRIVVESDKGTTAALPIQIQRPPLLTKMQIVKCIAAGIGAILLWIFIASLL